MTRVPWLELAVVLPLAGAACMWFARDVWRNAVGFAAGALACAAAALAYPPSTAGGLALDVLSGLLFVVVAALHFLTALATPRAEATRAGLSCLLAGEAFQLAAFASRDPWAIGVLLALGTLPPYIALLARGRPTRAFAAHMALFVALLFVGLATTSPALLMAAVLVRCGTFPAHAWVPDLVKSGPTGAALMFLVPLAGIYAGVRLVLPTAPDWVLQGIGAASLLTAVYAAGMATVQEDARRFFGYLFLSHAALVLVGLELHTVISLTGALSLWGAVALSVGGLGLTLRATEARFGRLPLTGYLGLFEQSPALAVSFLLTGLATVGFPGTLGFVGGELLVDGAVGKNVFVGVVVVVVATLNGIALLRAYFLVFTGARHTTGVSLGMTPRERFAVLALVAVIFGGGLAPQYHIESRHRAAEALLRERDANTVRTP